MPMMNPVSDKSRLDVAAGRTRYEINSVRIRLADALWKHRIEGQQVMAGGELVLDFHDATGSAIDVSIGTMIRFTSWRVRRSASGIFWIAGSLSGPGIARLEVMHL